MEMPALRLGFQNKRYIRKGLVSLQALFSPPMKKSAFYLLFVTIALACNHKRPLAIPPKLIWQTNPFDQVQIETFYPIFFDNKIIISQNKPDGLSELLALSVDDGTVVWKYADLFDTLNTFYYNLKPYMFNTILVLPNGARTIAIDMNTGKKIWSKQFSFSCEQFLEGHGRYAFQTFYPNVSSIGVCRFDCTTGESDIVYRENILPDYKKVIRTPTLIIENGLLKSLLLCRTEQEIATRKTTSTLSVLGVSSWKIEKTDTLVLEDTHGISFTKQPKQDPLSDKIYFMLNEELICYELSKFSCVWKTTLPRDMLTSEINYTQYSIFLPTEDGFLHCINKNSGQIIWRCPISGTPSRGYLTGDYFNIIGGGSGIWYVINTAEGKLACEIKSPNFIHYNDIFWRRYFTVSSDQRRAIATDGKAYFLYSFE
jgi:outer membrane protein assembly factor BamB